ALSNGHYVVVSPSWNSSSGAVTWGDGNAGSITGPVSGANSVVGSPNDQVGWGGVTPLPNGHFVISSPYWNSCAGAVSWRNGSASSGGTVGAGNSLTGSSNTDNLSLDTAAPFMGSGCIAALPGGNKYRVCSPKFNGGIGAVSVAEGTYPIAATVQPWNS